MSLTRDLGADVPAREWLRAFHSFVRATRLDADIWPLGRSEAFVESRADENGLTAVDRAMVARAQRVSEEMRRGKAKRDVSQGETPATPERQRELRRPKPGRSKGVGKPTKRPDGGDLVRHNEQGQRLCSRGCRRPARPPKREGGPWRWCEQCTAERVEKVREARVQA